MATQVSEPDDEERQEGPKVERSSSLHKMLNTLLSERRKDQTTDSDFIVVNDSAAFWTTVFSKYFIINDNGLIDGSRDDLLFFVRNSAATPAQRHHGSSTDLTQLEQVQVFRKASKNLPSLGDPSYNWEETVYLNLILQKFEYTLTCAVCSRTGDRELQILKKHTQKVYASPSRRSMEFKGTEEQIAYPDIFFTVDNFDEAFADIVVRDSEMVCVELVATDKGGDFQAVIFIGSIRYEALRTVFESRQSTLSARMKQSFSGWSQQTIGNKRTEFIRMRGPHGKGYAEMAISRQRGVPDTPAATPRATPLTTPATTPGATPEQEDLPPFPDGKPPNINQQNNYTYEERRMSDSASNSPFRGKWGFNIKKSQSATENVTHDSGEVEAKSISEELHQPGQGLFGRSFGQAWHWFKEQRRAASIGLNSCLTYVTLPWHRIIADVLDNPRTPVLSF